MLTQRANLANLVTTIQSGRTVDMGTPALTEPFQAYVAEGGSQWKTDVSVDSTESSRQTTDTSHKDAYEMEKLSTDSYSVNKEKVQTKVETSEEEPVEELTEEELAELQDGIRNVLKDALNMTDEEIDEVLAIENLSLLSLLKPENLQQFLLGATDTEPVDLLTDNSLIDVLQQMSAELESLVEEFELTETDLEQLVTQEFELLNQEEMPIVDEKVAVNEEVPVEETAKSQKPEFTPETEVQLDDLSKSNETTNDSEDDEQSGSHMSEGKAEAFTVKEEETGIQVSVHSTQHGKDGQEETQQGIATDIVNQLTQAVNDLEETPISFSSDVQQTEIIRQVIEQIRVVSGNDMNQIEVQLYPQHLGRVQIQVMMKNGVMTAQIHAETEMAKEAIESQLQQLKETFQEKSIQVEAVEVSVGTSSFQREQDRQDSAKNQQGPHSRRRIRLDEFGMPMDELTMEEQIASERLEAQGASVEFTA